MTDGDTRQPEDDAGEWEAVRVARASGLGAVVSVRFDERSARRIRDSARALGLSLSELVRRAALAAIDKPELLSADRDQASRPFVLIAGGRANLVLSPDRELPTIGNDTFGKPAEARVPETYPAAQTTTR